MKYTKQTYIFGLVAAMAFTSCSDDALLDSPDLVGSGEYVSFAAGVSTGGALASRSADTPYEPYDPLVLDTDQGEFPVYLHTYEHAIGSDAVAEQPLSRSEQVDDVDDFSRLHKSFLVDAFHADGTPYFPMLKARELTDDHRYWTTPELKRWPRTERLSFHAVAPFDHLDELEGVSYSDKKIEFSYTAKKSHTGDLDAEYQPDLLMAVTSMTLNETVDYDYHVPLKFNHALSAIKFAVRDVLEGEVVSIAILDVKGSGKCVYTADYNSEGGKFEWDTEGVAANSSFKQMFNHKIEERFPVYGDINDEQYDVVLTDKMPAKTFMMIPQVIPDDARIELVIKRDNTVEEAPETITVRGKIKANNVLEWKPGYEYIYTISTSKDNWVYVFDAEGNVDDLGIRDAAGNLKNHKENIYVYSPAEEAFDVLDNNAYFNVKSYRYRANDMSVVQALPWTAEHDGSLSYWVKPSSETAYPQGNEQIKWVSDEDWITDQNGTYTHLSGDGIGNKEFPWERHDIKLKQHYISTTWAGDEWMQAQDPYPGYTEESPYDLSTFGGKIARTTANCYVVDRGGWYMFPLVYGNAIKKGVTNTNAYTCLNTNPDATTKGYILSTLIDYNNNDITGPYINAPNANATAELLWQDAYDFVDNVELVYINGERMIRFYVEPNNLQQGNAVIALKTSSGTIRWSWHIWATEHWLDPNPSGRLPHIMDPNNSAFNYKRNAVTDIRERGDVEVTYNQKGRSFMMSPYNVGYCDPKSVLYLKRKATMKFVQLMPDKSAATGLTDELPIIQDGTTIEYKYANNTYYQWGRKDPMRGFFDHEHSTKRVFGNTPPVLKDLEDIGGAVTIGYSIKHPEEVFVSAKGEAGSIYEDWLTTNFKSNLWNNASVSSLESLDDDDDHESLWSHTKTVYDPSPAGYMVPNAGVWHVIQRAHSNLYTDATGKMYTNDQRYYYDKKYWGDAAHTIPLSQRDKWAGGNWPLSYFSTKANGRLGKDDYNYVVWGKGNAENLQEAIFFSSTGNRWWTDGWTPNGIGKGENFGRNVSYAWSSRSYTGHNAYGMAIGLDTDRTIEGDAAELRYYVGGQFIGRRTMGRPVRAIREPDF